MSRIDALPLLVLGPGEHLRVRLALWSGCPHPGRYGDDGELQCGGTDFLRDPLVALLDHLEMARLAASEPLRAA